MKIGVSIWSVQEDFYANRIDTLKFINTMRLWPIDGIELLDYFFKSDTEIEQAIRLLQAEKIAVAAFSIEVDFTADGPAEFKAQIQYVKDSIDLANRFGTKLLRVLNGSTKAGLTQSRSEAFIEAGLRSCLDYAAAKGVTLVLENSGYLLGTSQKLKNMISLIHSPNLKANADIISFLLQREDPVKAVSNLRDMLGYVHLNDIRRIKKPNGKLMITAEDNTLYQGTALGEGEADFPAIIRQLRDIGYDGYLCIEYEGVGAGLAETRASVDYIRRIAEL